MLKLILAGLTLAAYTLVAAELQLKKPCGDIECNAYFFCDPGPRQCRACEPICNTSSTQYHPSTCEHYCQDYIHDIEKGYLKLANIPDIINTIYWQVTVILFLLVVLVVLVGSIVARNSYKFFKNRRRRRIEDKRFKEKLASVQYTINNNSSLNDGSIKCIMQSGTGTRNTLPSSATFTSPTTTMTETPCSTNRQLAARTLPLSSEEPSEDATLDYASYVNQALSHSPSTETNLDSPKY